MSPYTIQTTSTLGTMTMVVSAPNLEAAVKRTRKHYPDAEPMIGPMSKIFYVVNRIA